MTKQQEHTLLRRRQCPECAKEGIRSRLHYWPETRGESAHWECCECDSVYSREDMDGAMWEPCDDGI
jgi:hypothetical protein